MIEAANSAVSNASVVRGLSAQAVSSTSGNVAPPVEPQSVADAPQAPFVSPYISVDLSSNKAVLQIRNSDTGDVEQQFPTESRLAEIRRAQVRQETQTQNTEAVRQAPDVEAPAQSEAPSSSNIITVQDITSAPPSNISTSSPQTATAALSAGAQSADVPSTGSVSVLA